MAEGGDGTAGQQDVEEAILAANADKDVNGIMVYVRPRAVRSAERQLNVERAVPDFWREARLVSPASGQPSQGRRRTELHLVRALLSLVG